MAAPAKSNALPVLWCVHGGLIAFIAVTLPAGAATAASPEWAEMMRMVGAGDMIAPTRDLLAVTAGWWPWLLGLAVISAGAGVLGWMRPAAARWPYHAAAIAHLVLAVPATIRTHPVMVRMGGGIGDEVLGLVLLAAGLAWSSWRVERTHRAATAAPTSPGAP